MRPDTRDKRQSRLSRKSFLGLTGTAALGAALVTGGGVSAKGRGARVGRGKARQPAPESSTLLQPLEGAAAALFEYAQDVPVIDTHEHIPRSERDYNAVPLQFGHLLNPYIAYDLVSSGMPFPQGAPVGFHVIEDNWDAIEPYWKRVRFGSYARALRIGLQHFYGVDDLTRENHAEVARKVSENNTPGIFKRVFSDTCRIEKIVRNAGDFQDPDDPLLVANLMSPSMMVLNRDAIGAMAKEVGADVPKTLGEFNEAAGLWMAKQVERGAVAFKTGATPLENPDFEQAEETYRKHIAGEPVGGEAMGNLGVTVREVNARKAAELDVPLCFHTGVWGDFRGIDPQHLIGLITRNPGTRVDLYHMGIPSVRPIIQMVKNFPNAYLNLCWAHIIASDMTVQTLKEAVDMVPTNKIFAFGGDYHYVIEKVYGHLQMARENVAVVLGDRVDRNLMGLDEAQEVLRAWFYDNPKAFYRL